MYDAVLSSSFIELINKGKVCELPWSRGQIDAAINSAAVVDRETTD
jgi:hypothetical protein